MSMNKMQGFTLMELMITVVIVAVLAAVAVPIYQDSIAKSRRAEAVSALMTGAQRLEAYYTANGSYLNASNELAPVFATAVPTGGNAYYSIAQDSTDAATATTFKLVASATGAMANDACGNLAIDQKGARYKSGSADESLCWRR